MTTKTPREVPARSLDVRIDISLAQSTNVGVSPRNSTVAGC
jgi:hypothetical protein